MHPKNTTAPPGAQHAPSLADFGVLTSFTYFEVRVVMREERMKQTFPGLADEAMAEELKAILQPCFASRELQICWVAADPHEDQDQFMVVASRLTDMIISVRTAANPGHEFLSRLGYYGEYTHLAPQNATSPLRGAGGGA